MSLSEAFFVHGGSRLLERTLMNKLLYSAVLAAVVLQGACGPSERGAVGAIGSSISSNSHAPVCDVASDGEARCHAWVRVGPDGRPSASRTPTGYTPADLVSAYHLPSATAGLGQTVAIVDAYDDPSAESDLAVYRSYFGLPPCTTANGCFRKVGQTGSAAYP